MGLRIDTYRIDSYQIRQSDGVMIVPARIARVGIQTYQNMDGTERRELRKPEEVFEEASMRSFDGVAVTMLHPGQFVSPENYTKVELGHSGDKASQDGEFLTNLLYIADKELQDRIISKEFSEISNGYYADYIEEPGENEYGKYDGYQSNIRGNHIAIGTKNWGRAGPDVRVLIDSNGDATIPSIRQDNDGKGSSRMEEFEIVIDGITYVVQGDKPVRQALARMVADVAEAKEVADKAAKELVKAEAEISSKETEIDGLKSELVDAKDPVRIEQAAAERSSVVSDATRIAGKDIAGNSILEIKKNTLVSIGEDFEKVTDGKSEDYIEAYVSARFDALKSTSDKKEDSKKDHNKLAGDLKPKESKIDGVIDSL